jgi:hypothetical protein
MLVTLLCLRCYLLLAIFLNKLVVMLDRAVSLIYLVVD